MMDGLEVSFKLPYLYKDQQLLAIKLEMLFVKVILVKILILPHLIQVSICLLWINLLSKLGVFGTGIKLKEVNGISGATSIIVIEEEPGYGSITSQMEIVEIDSNRLITFINSIIFYMALLTLCILEANFLDLHLFLTLFLFHNLMICWVKQ